jgi:hypothetical protein
MSRASSSQATGLRSRLADSFSRLYAANPALILSMAFEAGMLLGRHTNFSGAAKKVRSGASSLADQVVELAPSSMTKLVPDIFPAKSRKPSRRKTSGRKRASTKA